MKWLIPAKTFLLGEYVALEGSPAFILTTAPCFELHLTNEPKLQGIHPESPAGLWWAKQGCKDIGLRWIDPYHGWGGMGASSAQFVGAYMVTHQLQSKQYDVQQMLADYFQCAWRDNGLRPSGYDVLAQMLSGCVYIHHKKATYLSSVWPFPDLAFVLLHTGQKLATHEYLQSIQLPSQLNELEEIVILAKEAMDSADSTKMIDAINQYHLALVHRNKVALHSLKQIDAFKKEPEVLAVKGCGAMGADVLLLLVAQHSLASFVLQLKKNNRHVLATSADLYINPGLFTNNPFKTLDILP